MTSLSCANSKLFTSDPARDPGLFHTASFLIPIEQLQMAKVSKLFYSILDSSQCWVQQCRTQGLSLLEGISPKKVALDVFPILMKNAMLCRPLNEIDPAIVRNAIERIYARDSKGRLIYAPDPIEPKKLIKDTFVLAAPCQFIAEKANETVLQFPLAPKNLSVYMKKYYGIGFDKKTFRPILKQHGYTHIPQPLLFMRTELAYKITSGHGLEEQRQKIEKSGLTISSLAERIFLNFLVYANSGKFLDRKVEYAYTSTMITVDSISLATACKEYHSGLRLVTEIETPFYGLAVGFSCENS